MDSALPLTRDDFWFAGITIDAVIEFSRVFFDRLVYNPVIKKAGMFLLCTFNYF